MSLRVKASIVFAVAAALLLLGFFHPPERVAPKEEPVQEMAH